ncbi:tRNA epoxyqueuosine(34) reductase QueG [Gynurincola endophyticus]|uniref:tRNA epoxyqueuosine(34) reductase QueG n=1 Tax=Gynurincola endophyticus TaxID=2479004 RepID=UPI000F8F2009|nr:tRNA epoxyqueuosine(34) reductase QueG [Gynurincola endophyticus]
MNPILHSQSIKQWAQELGFSYCGIAEAKELTDHAHALERWLNKGMHGSMHYMENHFDLRIDPRKIVPGARSVITLLMNYFPQQVQQTDGPKISKYAYGEDYHEVIRPKLRILLEKIRENIGEVEGRGFVDSAPVLERAWAEESGLGWIGKNGNLITKQQGSFFFISTLITDLPLAYDNPYTKDFCGSCTRCIDACPTQAIHLNKVIDGSKCISYYTIELKDEIIPASMQGKFDDWMFGCDTCQDVCPWNRFSQPHQQAAFSPVGIIQDFNSLEWEQLTEEAFKKVFKLSPLKRSKWRGIMRNLKFIQSESDK